MPVLLNDGQIKEPVAATIGVFDGVHRGHRFVLSQLVAKARERGLNTMAITFKRHPLCVVRKDFRQQLLMGLDDRLAAIESMGIDYVVALDFTEDMSRMTAGQFLDFIHRHYSVRMLLTGYDNKFGSSRSDTFEDYVKYGKEVGVEVVRCNEFNPGGVKISSSEIRSRLAVGDVRSAAEMLGRRYRLSGTVVGGLENGRKIGFPTANISVGQDLAVPRNGVYAVVVYLPGGMVEQGMLNIGNRPTLGDNGCRSIEVNIFGFSGNLYGQQIAVEFVDRLRDERKMGSFDELKAQLAADREKTKEILSKSSI